MKSGLKILFCTLALAANVKAQDFFPSAKAIGLSFTHIPDERLKNANADLQLDQWAVSAPAFYLPSDNWALGGGLSYEYSLLEYTNSSVINERELHSLSVPIVVTLDSTENLKWIGMINPNISGDFETIDSDSVYLSSLVGANYIRNENWKWLFGVFYSNGLDDDFVVPAVGFQWKISEDSDLFFGGPIIRYNRNLSPRAKLTLGSGFASNRWNTQASYAGADAQRDIRLRAYRLSAAVEWSFSDKHSITISSGMDFARELEITDRNSSTLLEGDLDSTPVFKVGYNFKL